jgi:hypothetical protein
MMMMMTRNDPSNRNDDGRSDQCNTATILSSPSKRRALVDENCVQIPPLDVLKQQQQQQQHPKLSSSSSSSSSLQKDGRSSGKSKSTGMKIPQQHHHQQEQEQIVRGLESAMIQLVRLNNIPLLLEQAVLVPVTSHSMQDQETTTKATISSISPPILEDSTKASLSQSSSSPSSSTDKAPPQQKQQQQHPECLTSDKDTWISFRMAHSGDAATIANWYHESELQKSAVAAGISSKENKHVDSDIDDDGGDDNDDDNDDDDKPEIDTKPPPPTATNCLVDLGTTFRVTTTVRTVPIMMILTPQDSSSSSFNSKL